MKTEDRVWMSTQLCCMLPSLAVKVLHYLLNWNKPEIKYFEKQMTKLMHLTKEELELAIQTLVDNNLISIRKDGDTFVLVINREQIKKYYNVPLQKVHDHQGFQLSKNVTWNKVSVTTEKKELSDEDIEKKILMLQAMLKERQQVKELITSPSADDLF